MPEADADELGRTLEFIREESDEHGTLIHGLSIPFQEAVIAE